MQDLIATKRLKYDGVTYNPGDAFKAKPKDAKLWIAIKKARPASDEATVAAEPQFEQPKPRKGRPAKVEFVPVAEPAEPAEEPESPDAPVDDAAAAEPEQDAE